MSGPAALPPYDAVTPRRLLVVDDDVELCALVSEYLGREGFIVVAVHDGPTGLAAALAGGHDAIVLDVMLPGLGGFELLRLIRERLRTPILMLTARGDHVDRIVGLEMGADDYVPKPFDPRELVARIRAVLRRADATVPPEPALGDRLVVGELSVDPGAREARRGGRVLQLTPVEFDLLVELMRSVGRVLSRDQLSRAVLGRPSGVDDRSIDTHIGNLRRKLGAAPDDSPLIRTVRAAGFLLAKPDSAAP
jgi:DNA-binding response OmpR family regulator